jgi:hypothetical protein
MDELNNKFAEPNTRLTPGSYDLNAVVAIAAHSVFRKPIAVDKFHLRQGLFYCRTQSSYCPRASKVDLNIKTGSKRKCGQEENILYLGFVEIRHSKK